jgi:hypothetical protein
MLLRKSTFFAILFLAVALPFWVTRVIWFLGSKPAIGTMQFKGMGSAGDQLPLSYSVISFRLGKDTIWFNGLGNLGLQSGDPIPIRYRPGNPANARVDIFAGIWGEPFVFSLAPLLVLIVMFVHRKVVPSGARVRLNLKKPFVQLVLPPDIQPSQISNNG